MKNAGICTALSFILLVSFGSKLFADQAKADVELEPIVVTPWRMGESVSDISRNVTVITQDDIKSSSAQYLPQLIQDKTSIVVTDYFGNPKNTIVDVRGFGETSLSNVLVLIDGRRTNQVDLSGVDWSQIDLDAINSIEIVRGPSTVLYGDNASAAVINIITKKGMSARPSMKIAGLIGSHKYHKNDLSISGQGLSGILEAMTGKAQESDIPLDYYFSFSNQDTTGYRANNDYWANDYFSRLTFYPTDMFELGLTGGYHRDHYGMPGALYWNGNPNVPGSLGINQVDRHGTDFPDDHGFTSDGYITAEPQYKFFFANTEVTASLFGSYRNRRSKGLNVTKPIPAWFISRGEYETTHNISTYELRPKIQTSLDWRWIDNDLIIGADYFHAKDEVLSGNRLGDQQDETDVYKETLGLYIHDNIKFSERFLMNAGARASWADYTFKQKRLIVSHDTKGLKTGVFNVGAGYKYNERSQFYIDISKGYRFPNTEEYYQNKFLNTWTGQIGGGLNTSIKDQQSMNYEAGLKDLSFEFLSFDADVFLMDVKNEIYYDPSTYENRNYSPTVRHYGLEVQTRADLFDGRLSPFFNWVLQESFFKGGTYAGNRVPLVPKSKLAAGITLSPVEGLDWTTGLVYVGSRYMISDQNNIAARLKAYLTVDTKLDYRYKYMNVWAGVRNVFDNEYFIYGVTNSTATAEAYYPAPERRFEAGMSITF